MSTKKAIDHLTIRGFKSIKSMERLKLENLNILIGANGSGKSNFVSYFRMLRIMMAGRLQNWTTKQGTSDRIVTFGVKETQKIESSIEFGSNEYKFELEPTLDGGFSYSKEQLCFDGRKKVWLGSGHQESKLPGHFQSSKSGSVSDYFFDSIMSSIVYHLNDTSETAGLKRVSSIQDNDFLMPDASNLPAYIYHLRMSYPTIYTQIRDIVALVLPSFDDFVLKTIEVPSGEQMLWLLWKQRDSDYVLWPSQLSDGSIRFICLVTALLQPDPPSTILIDEPELGLHPHAITLLAALFRSASQRMQVIVATQSVPLINEFSIDDLIVVEMKDGASTFERKCEADFASWLEDYTIGELWQKNVLGGRPAR